MAKYIVESSQERKERMAKIPTQIQSTGRQYFMPKFQHLLAIESSHFLPVIYSSFFQSLNAVKRGNSYILLQTPRIKFLDIRKLNMPCSVSTVGYIFFSFILFH